MQLALFGTSADPPTIAHQQILLNLAQQFDRVVVWASDNPFKQHGASLADRTQMLELVVADANDRDSHRTTANIQLCPNLSHRYTIVTLERAKALWSEAHFTLVIGSDLLGQIHRWYRADELLHQLDLLVIPRPDFPVLPATIQALEAKGTTIAIGHWKGLPVSSTAFREAGSTTSITPPVYNFIRRNQLYSTVYSNA